MLEAVVFLTALYPLITAFGLIGAGWAGVIAYAFACVNRLVALNKIIPGLKSKLLIGSLSTLLAGGAGLVIASFSLTFIISPLPRVILGGLISLIIPTVILLLVKADLRKWIVSWFS
jgi:O-antigen/teichoic acid export membrane protein